MNAAARQFIEDFLEPLLGGGEVVVGAPISPARRAQLLDGSLWQQDESICRLRDRRARTLIDDVGIGVPEDEEVELWISLHNLLSLDHPDVGKVWARETTWQNVEADTRRALWAQRVSGVPSIVLRHVWVGALTAVQREDHFVMVGEETRRVRGRPPSQRSWAGLARPAASVRSETVLWVDAEHSPATDRLLAELMWTSPLSCLLDPQRAPAQWTPLSELVGACLRDRALVRAICYSWERRPDWVLVGADLTRRLLEGLGVARNIAECVPGSGGLRVRPGAPWAANASGGSAMLRFDEHGDVRPFAADDAETDMDDVADSDEWSSPSGGDAPELPAGEDAQKALPGLVPEEVAVHTAALVGALVHLHALKVFEFDARIGLGSSARDWAVQAFLALPLVAGQLEDTLGSPLAGAESTGFSRRWAEYTDHLRGLVPHAVLENMLATLVARIVEDTQQ